MRADKGLDRVMPWLLLAAWVALIFAFLQGR